MLRDILLSHITYFNPKTLIKLHSRWSFGDFVNNHRDEEVNTQFWNPKWSKNSGNKRDLTGENKKKNFSSCFRVSRFDVTQVWNLEGTNICWSRKEKRFWSSIIYTISNKVNFEIRKPIRKVGDSFYEWLRYIKMFWENG